MPTFGVSLRRRTSVPLSDFPVQCQQGCVPAINAINTCTSSSCVRVPTVDSSLAYCVSCSVNADPTPSIIQSGQQLLDSKQDSTSLLAPLSVDCHFELPFLQRITTSAKAQASPLSASPSQIRRQRRQAQARVRLP
ncbi:hypothetical protein M378DRAFT_170883 [Amanita muscaria Koide BX008]|uniref:Uncharacterized protein n=1 Tax=Amanita muscaria (strain Koide BX008) TaxID=946122 RepID=A0A0C2RXD4_AMAMK|nr:hypothetical protein M378DRAFT_173922 [Amanita muscaria Koide BX008]KIL58159.1 hypothetical protein M378DRAFT_170883 [Amanita muscaria Koide BX008]